MMDKLTNIILLMTLMLSLASCSLKNGKDADNSVQAKDNEPQIGLIVLAPGHFHAYLLQKNSMPQVNDSVFVYAPTVDAGLKQYLSSIESFNQREEAPTNWKTNVYTGDDFLEKMIADKKGNVVVLAGNNREKTNYILRAVDAGLNVLSDKPMAIDREDFLFNEEEY